MTETRSWISTMLELKEQRQNGLAGAAVATETLARMHKAQVIAEIGTQNAGYLFAIADELTGDRAEVSLPTYLLLAALERAWKTGRHYAQQGRDLGTVAELLGTLKGVYFPQLNEDERAAFTTIAGALDRLAAAE